MIPRPKNTDTMDDIYKMQEDFIKEKESKRDFAPPAQAIKLNNNNSESTSGKEKPKSLFARQRNLKQQARKEPQENESELSVIKDVVERKYDAKMDVDDAQASDDDEEEMLPPFPKTLNINFSEDQGMEKGSVFARIMSSSASEMVQDSPREDNLTEIHKSIDEENRNRLQAMSSEEIMAEREKLLKSLDPGLVNFLRGKRKHAAPEDGDEKPTKEKSKPKVTFDEKITVKDLPPLDILSDENAPNWLNMNLLEPEKLEWTKDIDSMTKASIEAGSKFEARFDWKGVLLPYVFNEDIVKDDRELFMHGDEPNRPGYTLQELFRLARANVLQQRISALTAIAGVLNICNQGYYDGILQLPISKIFFFLRFAVDENVPAIIQAALRGISVLFYNETDETLLDAIYETPSGYYQPLMSREQIKASPEIYDIEGAFSDMSFSDDSNLISCDIEDNIEGSEKQNLSDFHLAETNLVECLLRTNIIERITFILTSTEPNPNIIEYCAKILIRIARDSQQNATTILNKQALMKSLALHHLSDTKSLESSHLIVKLFRIIGSYDATHMKAIQNYGVVDAAINFVTMKEDLNMNLIKLQIECFRLLRLYFHATPDESKYNQLLMPLRYLIEWHYQFLEFSTSNHFVIRTHASALVHLLGRSNITVSFAIFGEIFKMCCSKWYHMANRDGVTEFSQRILLSSLLDVASNFIRFGPEFFYDFLNEYFIKFMKSSHYRKIDESLLASSLLFKDAKDRSNVHWPLPNMGTVTRREVKTLPTLILSQEYSAYFVQSILTFINSFDNAINVKNQEFHQQLRTLFFSQGGVKKYMNEFCSLKKRLALSSNWFALIEIELIYNLLKSNYNSDECSQLYETAFNLLHYLSRKQHPLALDILEKFIFNETFYANCDVTQEELDHWRFIYNGVVMSCVKDKGLRYIAVVDDWNIGLLSDTWTNSLLLFLLYKVDISADAKRVVEIDLKEEDIIRTTLKFNMLLHDKDVLRMSPDDQLMHLMLVYFGADLNFLDADIKALIKDEMDLLKKGPLTFGGKLNGEKSFENLYMMFLETFQANGYGDNLFSALTMIPLAQKYDVKWRKLIWSEYAMVLKFIRCTESDLLVELGEYLYPIESDESVIKSYASALQSNYLSEGSLPWTIAKHHVTHFRPPHRK